MTADWSAFEGATETEQAAFLLDLATRAVPALADHPDVQGKVAAYVHAGHAVLNGDMDKHADLVRFLNDPDTDDDFNVYFAQIHEDERACAALDLATYACGFTARITAAAAGVGALPDPVLEALPEVSSYFQDRAVFLGL